MGRFPNLLSQIGVLNMSNLHEIVNALPVTTTKDWTQDTDSPDCSSGCKFFLPLAGSLGNDWGVCACPRSPRAGLLTWEHMGCGEFRLPKDETKHDAHHTPRRKEK